MTNYDEFRSSDIEDFISKPVSFSLNDDFFSEETPSKEKYMHQYDHIEPMVQSPKYTSDNSFKKGTSRRKEEPKEDNQGKYSVFPAFTGKMKYEFAIDPEYMGDDPEYTDRTADTDEEKLSFEEPAVKTNIFGEGRTDEDILFNYDVNRLFDIQKEISVLINAIQRLQASQVSISRQEEELKQRAQKAIKENERKKAIIDKLVDDITSLYDVLKLRSEIVEQKEDILLKEIPAPGLTYSPAPIDEAPKREAKWAEKPLVDKKREESPGSFSVQTKEQEKTKNEDINDFTFHDISSLGLNQTNISAINSAISSLK